MFVSRFDVMIIDCIAEILRKFCVNSRFYSTDIMIMGSFILEIKVIL